MATACLSDAVPAFERLEHDYIRQHYELAPGQKRPTADHVSELFGQNLKAFYGGGGRGAAPPPLQAAHRHLARAPCAGARARLRTPLGYLGAFLTNTVHRKAMGAWLERVVFSSRWRTLPFATGDYRTRQVRIE
jgi:hypothetical protein